MLGQEGVGDKNHLEFKAEDCGSSADGQAASHTGSCRRDTQATRQVEGGFGGSEQMCAPGATGSLGDLE